MAITHIPVDFTNPGQVLACLGLMEAAEVLCGAAEGRFDWSATPCFKLKAAGSENPLAEVLQFLATSEIKAVVPIDWDAEGKSEESLEKPNIFPANEVNKMSLPVILKTEEGNITLSHWCDGSSRDDFKLYSGNRTAEGIGTAMLKGTATKKGKPLTEGVAQLWHNHGDALLADPFGVLCAMRGSYNFDPRGAWTSIDTGYSPNDLKHDVMASPLVEILAAWGLENARPKAIEKRRYCYGIWNHFLPLQLARAAIGCCFQTTDQRTYRFRLDMSGKNKVVCFATEENTK
ncbi:MAG: type I-U CRISPR-associated protein Cas8c [Gammaproteobacteria bacterium]|nr:type I-U CRISPR-associated protein Cas8c [Gammaproteobacteria bacterium]